MKGMFGIRYAAPSGLGVDSEVCRSIGLHPMLEYGVLSGLGKIALNRSFHLNLNRILELFLALKGHNMSTMDSVHRY